MIEERGQPVKILKWACFDALHCCANPTIFYRFLKDAGKVKSQKSKVKVQNDPRRAQSTTKVNYVVLFVSFVDQ